MVYVLIMNQARDFYLDLKHQKLVTYGKDVGLLLQCMEMGLGFCLSSGAVYRIMGTRHCFLLVLLM